MIFFKDGVKYEKYIGERKLDELKVYVDDFLREDDELKKKAQEV